MSGLRSLLADLLVLRGVDCTRRPAEPDEAQGDSATKSGRLTTKKPVNPSSPAADSTKTRLLVAGEQKLNETSGGGRFAVVEGLRGLGPFDGTRHRRTSGDRQVVAELLSG